LVNKLFRWLNSQVANKPKVAFEIIAFYMEKWYNLEINNVKMLKFGEYIFRECANFCSIIKLIK